MSVLCDLHTHTTASDGQYAPAQLVRLTKDRGLSVPAVTDHDTIAGVEELAGGEVIARPYFARVMMKHGYVSTNREAFDRYLDTEEFRFDHRL